MNLDYQHLLPQDFAADSRVWIYQCNRLLTIAEALHTEDVLENFVASWNSHGTPVKGAAHLFFGQLLVLIADESASGVSGCSTDSSVRVVKQLEQMLNVSLFDRQLLAFFVKDKIQLIPMSQLKYAIDNAFVDADTPYFNNTVLTLDELQHKWIIPIRESWLGSRLKKHVHQ